MVGTFGEATFDGISIGCPLYNNAKSLVVQSLTLMGICYGEKL